MLVPKTSFNFNLLILLVGSGSPCPIWGISGEWVLSPGESKQVIILIVREKLTFFFFFPLVYFISYSFSKSKGIPCLLSSVGSPDN